MHDPNGKKITQKQKIANKSHKVIAGRSDIQTNTIPGRRIWELFPKLEVSAVLVSRPARRTVPTRPLHITSPVRPTHFGMVINMFDAHGGEIVDIFLQNFGMTFLHEFALPSKFSSDQWGMNGDGRYCPLVGIEFYRIA